MADGTYRVTLVLTGIHGGASTVLLGWLKDEVKIVMVQAS